MAQWENSCAEQLCRPCHPDSRSRSQRHRPKVGGISSGRKRAHCTGETPYMAQWENSCAVPVIPTAGAALKGTGQRLEGSLAEGSVRIARGRRRTWHSGRTAVQNSCAVPVIPTAGAALEGTGQRLEGSLVEGSVRIARVETPYMAQWENRCAEQLCHARYFLPVASRRSFRFEIPLAFDLCLRERRLLSE